jgi:thiol-disulfide isomerase/thioredoxin
LVGIFLLLLLLSYNIQYTLPTTMQDTPTSKVIKLNDSNFIEGRGAAKIVHPKMKKGSLGMVMFGASWCGYCKKAYPEFSKASEMLGDSFNMMYVDCEKFPKFGKAFNIKSYPTISYFSANGALTKKYEEERHHEDFVADILKKSH